MVTVICEAVPDSNCNNYRHGYGETRLKPHSSKLFLTCLNKTLSINNI